MLQTQISFSFKNNALFAGIECCNDVHILMIQELLLMCNGLTGFS